MKKNDCIKNEIYRYTWDYDYIGVIIRFVNINGTYCPYIRIKDNMYKLTSNFAFTGEFRKASPLEKYWFELCEKAGQFVPKPTTIPEKINNTYEIY